MTDVDEYSVAPYQLEMHGIERSAHVDGLISAHLKKLQQQYDRIMSCKVIIRAPGAHHRKGEAFAVSIQLALPGGREVNVRRISNSRDPRQADLAFAINDAFRRTMRQLRAQVERLRDDVQHHEKPIGTVARLDPKKRFGFLTTTDGREVYFHANSVLDGKFNRLEAGDRVAYHEEVGENGPQASTVRVLGGRNHV